jgi:hypothetical protein
MQSLALLFLASIAHAHNGLTVGTLLSTDRCVAFAGDAVHKDLFTCTRIYYCDSARHHGQHNVFAINYNRRIAFNTLSNPFGLGGGTEVTGMCEVDPAVGTVRAKLGGYPCQPNPLAPNDPRNHKLNQCFREAQHGPFNVIGGVYRRFPPRLAPAPPPALLGAPPAAAPLAPGAVGSTR